MNNNDSSQLGLILAIIVAFPIFFVTLWTAILRILAVISGWRSLAAHFRAPPDARAGEQMVATGSMRAGFPPVSYRNSLGVSADENGIGLRVAMPLSGVPPLLLPWSAVRGGRVGKMLVWDTFTFETGAPGGRTVTVSVSGRASHALAEAWGQWGDRPEGVPRASTGSVA